MLHSTKLVFLLCKESDTTEGLNNNNSLFNIIFSVFSKYYGISVFSKFYGYLAYFYHTKAVSYKVSHPLHCSGSVLLFSLS